MANQIQIESEPGKARMVRSDWRRSNLRGIGQAKLKTRSKEEIMCQLYKVMPVMIFRAWGHTHTEKHFNRQSCVKTSIQLAI